MILHKTNWSLSASKSMHVPPDTFVYDRLLMAHPLFKIIFLILTSVSKIKNNKIDGKEVLSLAC